MNDAAVPRSQGRALALVFALGATLGFLHVALFRELAQKIPINYFSPHFFILAFTGLAAGALYTQGIDRLARRRPLLVLAFLALFLTGIWVYKGDSIFFWTLSLYYPMPIPRYGWIKAVVFVAALASVPALFALVSARFVKVWGSVENPRPGLALFFLGMGAGTLAGYPAQSLHAETMLLIGCMGLLLLIVSRPCVWVLGALLSLGIVTYGHFKTNYPILLSLKNHRLIESRITDNFKIDFYAFRDDSCVALALNEFLHVYTCRRYEDLPVELSYLNKVLSEGLEEYKALIVGCSIGLYPYQLVTSNPGMKQCVLVDVDRGLAEASKRAQEAIGLDLYKDPRFVLKAYEPRYYLRHETQTYDLLYLHRVGNAVIFFPYSIVPIEYYLLTTESLQHIFDHLLTKDGVYILDWGIPSEWEVGQFVRSLPGDVFFRAFWTTLSNNPCSGAPLTFVIASRNAERVDRISNRLLEATYFHEVRKDRMQKGYRITDDKPWLKTEVVLALMAALVPFLVPLLVLYRRTLRLDSPMPWGRRGAGRRYYILFGMIFSLFTVFTLGRVTRLFPLGVNPAWLFAEALVFAGVAAGLAAGSLFEAFPRVHRFLFLASALLFGLCTLFVDTAELAAPALAVVALQAVILGQILGYCMSRVPGEQRNYLYAFERIGAACGIFLFQVGASLAGFRLTGLFSAVLILVAGIAFSESMRRSFVEGATESVGTRSET